MNRVTLYTDDLITIQDASNLLGVSRMTIYRWMDSGILTRCDLSGTNRVFLYMSEVEKLSKERINGKTK